MSMMKGLTPEQTTQVVHSELAKFDASADRVERAAIAYNLVRSSVCPCCAPHIMEASKAHTEAMLAALQVPGDVAEQAWYHDVRPRAEAIAPRGEVPA